MEYDENFNSSDLVLPPDESEDNPRIGARAIGRIVEGAVVDRITTKQTVKALKDIRTAPGTQAKADYWYKVFTRFADTTLKIGQRPNTTPTPEDYLRFLDKVPDLVDGRNPLVPGAMAWSTLKNVEFSLDRSLTFYYPEWKLSKHHATQVDSLLKQHLKTGRATKQPSLEKQWISAMLVRKMVVALLCNAIEEGTRCWDSVIYKCLSLVIQAATCSRAGDTRQSQLYRYPVHLRWEHVVIKMTGTEQNPSMRMLIKLYHTKGHKDDPSKMKAIDLSTTNVDENDGTNNVVDPIKLLLIHALRLGMVEANTWAALLRDVYTSPGKTVQWTKPQSPIFFAIDGRKGQLDLTRPAPAAQMGRILKDAADLIGMMTLPVSHDIRRGSAKDLMGIPSIGHNETAVRKALGHTMLSASRGMTDMYAGRGSMVDNWSARLTQSVETATDPFGPEMALTRFPKQHNSTEEVDQMCSAESLDKNNPIHRNKATKMVTAKRRAEWVEEQRTALARPAMGPNDHDESTTLRDSAHYEPNKRPHITPQRAGPPAKNLSSRPVLQPLSPNTMTPFLPSIQQTTSTGDSSIDPYLRSSTLATSTNLDSIETPLRTKDPHMLPSLDDMEANDEHQMSPETAELVDLFCSTAGSAESTGSNASLIEHANNLIAVNDDEINLPASCRVLIGNVHDFMDYFARVNVTVQAVNDCLLEQGYAPGVDGNSRDLQTRFWFRCEYTGCDFAGFSEGQLRQHQPFCEFNPAQTPTSKSTMRKRKSSRGKYVPRARVKSFVRSLCLWPNCSCLVEFADYKSWASHMRSAHEATTEEVTANLPTRATRKLATEHDLSEPLHHQFAPGQLCQYGQDCSTTTRFGTRKTYIEHLSLVHGVGVNDSGLYMTGPEIIPFHPTQCLYPGCDSKYKTHLYDSATNYCNHLYSHHGVDTADRKKYFAWSVHNRGLPETNKKEGEWLTRNQRNHKKKALREQQSGEQEGSRADD